MYHKGQMFINVNYPQIENTGFCENSTDIKGRFQYRTVDLIEFNIPVERLKGLRYIPRL